MKIAVILGSTREGRAGERVATWAMRRLAMQEGVEAVLLDLKEFPLPFYAQAEEPAQIKGDYADSMANRWRDAVAEVDGFVLVTPEYNRGYPAVLKNAIDYLYVQWVDKPITMVSYSSGVIGGARVVEQLRSVVSHVGMIAVPGALHLGKVTEILNEGGEVLSGPFDDLLDKRLVDLVAWTKLLNAKRQG